MEQALTLNQKAIWIYRNLVPAHSEIGEQKKAEDGVSVLLQGYPQLTVSAGPGCIAADYQHGQPVALISAVFSSN